MYIGIDLGGTNVRVASSKSLESVAFDKIERFELSHDFSKDFEKITSAIAKIFDGEVAAIGIGTPGTYNEEKTKLISAKNLPEWVGVSFVEMLSRKYNISVFADNDAVVASLGEAFYGQGKSKNFIYVTWGTGIGGAHVKTENGRVISEKIDWKNYFEGFNLKCGGKEIAKKYNKSIESLNEKDWSQIMIDFEFYLTEISNKLGEKNIVIGGGATSKQKGRLQKVVDSLVTIGISLKISELGDDVGLYGAMALIKDKVL